MNQTAKKIIETCSTAGISPTRFFIIVPEWTDAQYYSTLMYSPFLVFYHGFVRGQHYFIDKNQGFEKITETFGTHLLILAVNIIDSYNEIIKAPDNILYFQCDEKLGW